MLLGCSTSVRQLLFRTWTRDGDSNRLLAHLRGTLACEWQLWTRGYF